MNKLRLKAFGLSLAAATAALLVVPSVEATPVNYVFQVTAVSGPLMGTVSNGSLSYDTSIIVNGGGLQQADLLTNLSFSFDGKQYDETTANTGFLAFDMTGKLAAFEIGNRCGVVPPTPYETCRAYAGLDTWFIDTLSQGQGGHAFVYSVPGFGVFGYGDVVFLPVGTPPVASVPEPSVLGMFGLGALLIGGFVSRRRHLC